MILVSRKQSPVCTKEQISAQISIILTFTEYIRTPKTLILFLTKKTSDKKLIGSGIFCYQYCIYFNLSDNCDLSKNISKRQQSDILRRPICVQSSVT